WCRPARERRCWPEGRQEGGAWETSWLDCPKARPAQQAGQGGETRPKDRGVGCVQRRCDRAAAREAGVEAADVDKMAGPALHRMGKGPGHDRDPNQALVKKGSALL